MTINLHIILFTAIFQSNVPTWNALRKLGFDFLGAWIALQSLKKYLSRRHTFDSFDTWNVSLCFIRFSFELITETFPLRLE